MVKSSISLLSVPPFALSPLRRVPPPLLVPIPQSCIPGQGRGGGSSSFQASSCGESALLGWVLFIFSVFFAPDEMSESRQTHVTLHDIDPQALEQLVQYAYTAEIVVGEGNVQVGASPRTSPFPTKLFCATFASWGLLCPSAQRCQLFLWRQLDLAVLGLLSCFPFSVHFPALFRSTCGSPGPGGCHRCPSQLFFTSQTRSALSFLLLEVLTNPALLMARGGTRVKILPLPWKLPFPPPVFSTLPDPPSCCQPASAQWCSGRLLQVPAQPAGPLQLPGHPRLC